jgi:hypothetical protein
VKGGSNGELSFANVSKVAITTISVIKNLATCALLWKCIWLGFFPKGIHLLHKTTNKRLVSNDA